MGMEDKRDVAEWGQSNKTINLSDEPGNVRQKEAGDREVDIPCFLLIDKVY
jgi:hypothetical protein